MNHLDLLLLGSLLALPFALAAGFVHGLIARHRRRYRELEDYCDALEHKVRVLGKYT